MPFRNSAFSTGLAAALLLVLIGGPLFYGVAHRASWPETPGSNDGSILELDVLHATEFRQRLGPYSRFHWNHPGPLYFYLAAPLYAFFENESFAVNLAAALIKSVCLAGIVMMLLRRASPGFALMGMIGLAATQWPVWNVPLYIDDAYPWNSLYNIWNPVIVLLPVLALQFAGALFAAGRVYMIVPMAILGSLAVQCHIGTAPVVGATGLSAVVMYALQRPRAAFGPEEWRAGLGLIFAALLIWAPPLHEELTESPGNLTKLAAFALHGAPELPRPDFAAALATVVAKLASFPMLPYLAWAGKMQTPGYLLQPAPFAAAVVIVLMEVALLAYGVLRNHINRRGFERNLGVLTGVAILVAVLSVKSVRGEPYDYLYDWTMYVGFLLTLGAAGVLTLNRGGHGSLMIGGIILVVAAASYNAAHFARSDYFGRTSDRAASYAKLRNYLDEHNIERPVIYMPAQGFDHWNYYAELLLLLVREGRDARVEGRVAFMFGRARMVDPARPPDGRLLFTDAAGFAESKRVFSELELIVRDGPVWIGALKQ